MYTSYKGKPLLNIRNTNNKCFLWCRVRYLIYLSEDWGKVSHTHRVKKEDRDIANTLNYVGIELPVKINDIHKIKRQNKMKFRVLEYHAESGDVNIVYLIEAHHCVSSLDLLLIPGEIIVTTCVSHRKR